MDLKKGHQVRRMKIASRLLQDQQKHAADSDQEKFTIDAKDFPSLSELSEKSKSIEKSSMNGCKTFSYSDKLKVPSQEGPAQIVNLKYNIQSKSRLSAENKHSFTGNESASGNSYNKNNYRENCNVMNPSRTDTTFKNCEQRNQTHSSFVQQMPNSVDQRNEKDCGSSSKSEFSFSKSSKGNPKSLNSKNKLIPAGKDQTLNKDNIYCRKSSASLNKGMYCDNSKNSESGEKSLNFEASGSSYINPNEASKSAVRNKTSSSNANSNISFSKSQGNSKAKTTAALTQSQSHSDTPLRARPSSQKERESGRKNDDGHANISSRSGNVSIGSQNVDRDNKPEVVNAEFSGVKKKKKRKSKIKRQTALQSGKLLVLTPETHSRILNQTNNITVHPSSTTFTNINDSEEYPELGATPLPKNNRENSFNAPGMSTKKETHVHSETECGPSLPVPQSFLLPNETLDDSPPKADKVKIVKEQTLKEEKVVHSNYPFTVSLFDMLLTTKPKKKEQEKKKSHIGEKTLSIVATKQVSALSVNPLDSSRPTIKRGKEREKPKVKKPSRMKKLILMGRKLRNENRAVPKGSEETFSDDERKVVSDDVRNDDNVSNDENDDIETEITTSCDELTVQRTSPLPKEYSCDMESSNVVAPSKNMEYNSTFNLPYASKTSLELKLDDSCTKSDSHCVVFKNNISNSNVEDEKYPQDQNHGVIENIETDIACPLESTNLIAYNCKKESKEDDHVADIRQLFLNQLDIVIDKAKKQGGKSISVGEFISVMEDAITDIKLLFKNSACYLVLSDVADFPIALRSHLLNVADVTNIAKSVTSDDVECFYDINNHGVVALSQNTLSSPDNSFGLSFMIGNKKFRLICSENNQTMQTKTENQDAESVSITHEEISTEISENNYSDEDRLNSAKILLHSRKFRSYCNHFVSKEIDNAVFSLLDDLARFQDRMHQKDPVKARTRRRLVYGIKEIKRHMKLKKLKCIIIATDIEDNQTEGGLNDTLKEIISLAEAYHIPYVFSHRRYNLGKLCRKSAPVSCVGIFNYEGSEKNFKKMLELQEESKHDYVEMTEKLSSELTNHQIKKLLVIMNEPATVIYEVTREVLREILLPYLIPKEHSIDDECDAVFKNTLTTPADISDIKPLKNIEVVTKPEFSNPAIESKQSIGYTSSKPLENSQETKIYTIFTKYKLVK